MSVGNWKHMLAADLKAGFLCHVSRFGQHDQHVGQNHLDDDVDIKNEANVLCINPFTKGVNSEWQNSFSFYLSPLSEVKHIVEWCHDGVSWDIFDRWVKEAQIMRKGWYWDSSGSSTLRPVCLSHSSRSHFMSALAVLSPANMCTQRQGGIPQQQRRLCLKYSNPKGGNWWKSLLPDTVAPGC